MNLTPEALLLLDIYVEAHTLPFYFCFFISSSSKTLCSGNVLGALPTPCALHQDGTSADARYTFISSAVSPSLPTVAAAGLDRRAAALADLRSIAAPVVVDPAAPPPTPSPRRRQLADPLASGASRQLGLSHPPHSRIAFLHSLTPFGWHSRVSLNLPLPIGFSLRSRMFYESPSQLPFELLSRVTPLLPPSTCPTYSRAIVSGRRERLILAATARLHFDAVNQRIGV
ncbi:hypothetical protein DFH09DRAFT_1368309 [Mycena vulgaris]|nr:hypothetical protein DFH09DRAFT_1368309 [Mycena vulgaris]